MKISNSYTYSFLLISLLIGFLSLTSEKAESSDTVSSNIESYLKSIDFNNYNKETVTVFSNFVTKNNGDFLTIDFMVGENGKVVVLTKDFEKEYYKFENYYVQQMVKYEYPVVAVNNEMHTA